MRSLTVLAVAALLILSAPLVSAYVAKQPPEEGGGPCKADGSQCNVYCTYEDGSLGLGRIAGTMYWNGSVWTDGVKSSPDMDQEAKLIVQANGTSCH